MQLKNKNGKIVGIDSDGNEVPVELGDSVLDSVDASAISTEEGHADYLSTKEVAGGEGGSIGMLTTRTPSNLYLQREQNDVLSGYDPDVYHASHFDDGKYRFTITGASNSDTDLYRIDDLEQWLSTGSSTHITQEASAIFGSGSDNMRVNDHVVLPDGRFAVFPTINDGPTTDVWVGDELANLSKVGQVTDSYNDVGSIVSPDGVVHHFAEDPDHPDATSETCPTITHLTTPVDDLTNATKHGVVFDSGPYGWETGDPDIVRIGGAYMMFIDRKQNGNYTSAVLVSDDLYNWRLQTDQLSPALGGDLCVTKYGGRLFAVTEQSGGADDISLWTIRQHNQDAQWKARNRGVYWDFTVDTADGLVKSTDGSAGWNLSPSNGQLELTTGTTSGSKINVVKHLLNGYEPGQGKQKMSWQAGRTFYADVDWRDLDGQMYIGTGAVDVDSFSAVHMAIGMDNSDIIGSVADGSTRNTTTLISGASGGGHQLKIEYEPFQRAVFYVDKVRRGELTSNLPYGNQRAQRVMQASVGNSSSNNREMHIKRVRVGQANDSRTN